MTENSKAIHSILTSSSISSIGDGIRTLIVPLIILQMTKSSLFFGLFLSVEFLVWIISTGVTGYVVDKKNRVKNLFYSNIVSSILMFIVSTSYFIAYSCFLLFIVMAIIGISIGEAFFRPASFSLLPDIVHNNLDRYNALLSVAVNSSLVAGYLIVGFGFYLIPWGILLSIDAFSFLISALIILTGLEEYSKNEKSEKINLWLDTKESFKFLKKEKFIKYTIIFGVVFNFLVAGTMVILPTIAVKDISIGSISLSLFYIAELIGMVCGGILIVARRKDTKLLNYLFIGSLGEGFVLIFIGLSLFFPNLLMILIIIIIFSKGIFSETINIPYNVWYQRFVPKRIRAKIYNVKDLILTIPMVIVYPLVGYLLDDYPNWLVIFILGLFTIIVSIMEYCVLREVLVSISP